MAHLFPSRNASYRKKCMMEPSYYYRLTFPNLSKIGWSCCFLQLKSKPCQQEAELNGTKPQSCGVSSPLPLSSSIMVIAWKSLRQFQGPLTDHSQFQFEAIVRKSVFIMLLICSKVFLFKEKLFFNALSMFFVTTFKFNK